MNKRTVMTTRYLSLVDKVTKIDPEAGRYLRNEVRDLGDDFSPRGGQLIGTMYWDETPQGHDFWSDIALKIKREERKCLETYELERGLNAHRGGDEPLITLRMNK